MKTPILPAFLVLGLVSVALAADPPSGLDPALLTKPPTDSWPRMLSKYPEWLLRVLREPRIPSSPPARLKSSPMH